MRNVIDATLYQDLVMTCDLSGIEMNVGVQIIDKWKHFYTRERSLKDLFLPSLITELCKRIEVPKEDHDILQECNVVFNPQKVKASQRRSKKNWKITKEGES